MSVSRRLLSDIMGDKCVLAGVNKQYLPWHTKDLHRHLK